VPLLTPLNPCADLYLLAQKLDTDLDKSTTVCKVGDLEYTRPKVHVYEVYAHKIHAYEVYTP
jgi:hypothetical protein